jgi:ATP-binding cassette subfamily B protein
LHEAVRFAFPHRYSVAAILALTLFVAAISAIEPLVLKLIFDGLTGDAAFHTLLTGLGALAAFAIGREGADAASNWLTWRTRIGLQYALLEATVGKLHRMPLRIQRSEGVGAVLTRLDRSIQGLVSAVSQILFNVIPALVFLVVATVIMINLDWRLALVVLGFAPMPALVALMAAPEQTARERTLLDRWARIYSRFNEVLSGILVVRSFSMEDAEKRRFLDDVAKANQVVISGVATDTGYGASSNIVVAIARIAAIGVGGWLVLQGAMTVGTVIAFLGYVGGLFGPVQGLSGVYQTVRKATVSLEEISKILNVQEHLGDSPDATELDHVRGEVEFDHVSFRYEQEGQPLLRDVSFRAEPGQTIAIVGPSGSGKTTLMAILMRFYDPQDGVVRVDGRDLRTVKQSSLRRKMAVVLQDPLLFNDTVRNNIAYAKPDATQQEIEAAAAAANADAFIRRLPGGYDAMVGERGALLSVGERQRITIARALLKDPSILILDEATSSLDAESEELVQGALDTLQNGRTTFVIAHRLSTVVYADRIVVLRDGSVAETGTHAELMQRQGYYASLVHRQRRGLIWNDAVQAAAPAAKRS